MSRKKKNVKREWSRVELAEAPQGHGLMAVHGQYSFIAFERDDGSWQVFRTYEGEGADTPSFIADSFKEIRHWVDKAAESLGGLQENPTRGEELIRMGGGALLGTVGGMLLGGIPGVLVHSTPLVILGTQTGAIVGAAAGAVVGARAKNSKDTPPHIRKLKARLLR